MKPFKSLLMLFSVGVGMVSCTHQPPITPQKHYDFTYSGSQYTGDAMEFKYAAASGDVIEWYFGNCISYGLWQQCGINYPGVGHTDAIHYLYRDSAISPVCTHIYNTPGTYTVTLTVNHDTLNQVKKVITISSPETLVTSLYGSRVWKRFYRYHDSHIDTSYMMADTVFAVSAGTFYLPFNYCHSNSSLLEYSDNDNPHRDPSIIKCDLVTGSIYMYRLSFWNTMKSESITYTSGK